MPRAEHGFRRILSEVLCGFAVNTLLTIFVSFGLDISWIFLFETLNTLALIMLILAVPYWGTGYLFGWLIGLLMMVKINLISTWEFGIYFGVPLVVLVIRVLKKFNEE